MRAILLLLASNVVRRFKWGNPSSFTISLSDMSMLAYWSWQAQVHNKNTTLDMHMTHIQSSADHICETGVQIWRNKSSSVKTNHRIKPCRSSALYRITWTQKRVWYLCGPEILDNPNFVSCMVVIPQILSAHPLEDIIVVTYSTQCTSTLVFFM